MRAYSGVEKYAFVSYSHCDSQKVIEILDKLALAGTRIWYDEGIAPSNDYISVIAKKIEDCAFFIAFKVFLSAPLAITLPFSGTKATNLSKLIESSL